MSKETRGAFNKMYGRILDLLDISVKTPVISALAQFWISDLHCFELPNLDLVPTIEEYMRMTRLPIDNNIRVYSYRGRYVNERKIAKLIGLHPNQLKFEKRGAIQGLRKSFLEDHLEALAGRGSWHYFNKTLALTIYGLILFPFAPNMVDHAAMDVFAQYETQGLNPVPAILPDTLITLEVCQKKNGGTLKCCTHLLYVWIITHICGDFANVPLMGPRGCVAYTPSIALRQLKRTQVKPMEEQLGGICFQYDVPDASKLLDRVRAAWKSVQRKGDHELGKPQISASQEYHEWRKARGVPEYILREAPHGEENQTQGEHLKKLLAEIADARNDTKNWWGLAKNYHEKNEELSQKVIKRKLKAKRKKQEANEAIEGWRLRTNVQRDKKREWMKRCDDMADCVNYHSIELAWRLGEAEDEIDRNPEIQLPPKTARFMRYCQDLARGFGRKPKCLM
ncbi:hypothetical protein SESBI_20720 [Sesbania bispinosa]|nr:hypothetical protein SESBI_20720 [Sesbania bispinosa]